MLQDCSGRLKCSSHVSGELHGARILVDVLWNEIESSVDGDTKSRLLVILDSVDAKLRNAETLSTQADVPDGGARPTDTPPRLKLVAARVARRPRRSRKAVRS